MKLFGGHKHSGSSLPATLQDDTQKFKVIFDSIEDGVVLIDNERVIRMMNPGAATICAWVDTEALGLDVNSVVTIVNDKSEPYGDADNPFKRIMNSKEPIHDNHAFILNRSKSLVPISLNITPLLDEDGKVNAAVAVFRNVGKDRAQEKQSADFISTASHEMRTPVAAIEGYLSLTLNEKVATIDLRARDYLEKAHASTQHLGQLFQDLLTSAKAEDGRLTSHPTVVELGGFLEQLTNDLRFAAEKKGLFMEFVVGAGSMINTTSTAAGEHVVRPLYYVFLDADRLREVITNLFDNAVKYTPEGKISVGLTGDSTVVQCYVRDTGPGIPAEDVPHLFQKFYRVDSSATRTIGGTGLGLFICRKIVELYNGRIWVESEVGKGSSFYINFPRITDDKASRLELEKAGTQELKPINAVATT